MNKGIFIVLLVILGVCARAEDPPSLASYRSTFEKGTTRIEAQHGEGMKQINASFLEALKRLTLQIQDTGNLEALLAIRAEMERLSAGKEVLAEEGRTLLPELASLRAQYVAACNKLEAKTTSRRCALTSRYVEALGHLMRQLTQHDRLDEAVDAQREREEMQKELQALLYAEALHKKIASSSSVMAKHSSNALLQGLVFHMDFDSVAEGRFLDRSGHEFHGALIGGQYVKNERGAGDGVCRFAQTGDRIELGDVLNDLDMPFTFSAWIKLAEDGEWKSGRLFQSDVTNGRYAGFWVDVSRQRTLSVGFGDGRGLGPPNRVAYTSNKELGQDDWVYITLVVPDLNSPPLLYLNATPAPCAAAGGDARLGDHLPHTDQPALIGGGSLAVMLDDLMIWNRALKPTEVELLYQATP